MNATLWFTKTSVGHSNATLNSIPNCFSLLLFFYVIGPENSRPYSQSTSNYVRSRLVHLRFAALREV